MTEDEPKIARAANPGDFTLLADEFAAMVTSTVAAIVPLDEPFKALAFSEDQSGRVAVGIIQPDGAGFRPFPLTISGKPRLSLLVKFDCCWDTNKTFLAVESSWFHVRVGDRDEPLFRYEYLRKPFGLIPAAHIQVHAHRDEMLYLMTLGDKGRARARERKDSMPRMAEFHFPVGGHRFRPCIEDVLEALILEFNIDACAGWKGAIEAGRADWRRTQLKAAVRDSQAVAAQALADLGWKIEPPQTASAENLDKMKAF